jgi:hypothetical protein
MPTALKPFTTAVYVAGCWLTESYATEAEAWEARDRLHDAGFHEARGRGPLATWEPRPVDVGPDADDGELLEFPR